MTEYTEQKTLTSFAEKAYLDYSMYVVLDRALPHIEDGLKPVQRRIIYAMSEMALTASAKFKKSARTVGDVLGKYHPHGDMACYEAMVLMAQSFSYRYPLIEGQGNWGTTDEPKSFAAMRYTEARLTRYAETLLNELGQGTVDWTPNFDGTMNEPVLLPARLPNVLLNGASGIAVGMATDIPPHNLNEVVGACIHLLHNPDAQVKDLCKHVQGPDYPTYAELITPKSVIDTIYQEGSGTLRMRAVYHQESSGDIVIDALPYQVSGSKVMTQIAEQIKAKKLPMVSDLRDESDHQNPIRFVITPRNKQVNVQALMDHLFITTDLEQNYRVNLNMIGTDGRPQVKNLKQILEEWLSFRQNTVISRLQYRLDKVDHRLHILEGLLIAYLNVDEVIRIIREEEHPKQQLQDQFNLTATQAEAILELKLRHLAKLEEQKIYQEQQQLLDEKQHLEATLNSNAKLKALIESELLEDAKRHGDSRCSPLVERHQAQALPSQKAASNEPVTLIVSVNGWARVAKGHDIETDKLSFKAGDRLLDAVCGQSSQTAVIIDGTGRCYSISPNQLPSARSQGEPLSAHLTLASGTHLVSALLDEGQAQYLLLTTSGYGFTTTFEDLQSKNRNGKAVVSLPESSQMLKPARLSDKEHEHLAMISQSGRLLIIPASYAPYLQKGKGNKLMQLTSKNGAADQLIALQVIDINKEKLIIYSGKRTLTLTPETLAQYSGNRASRGKQLPRGFRNVHDTSKEQA